MTRTKGAFLPLRVTSWIILSSPPPARAETGSWSDETEVSLTMNRPESVEGHMRMGDLESVPSLRRSLLMGGVGFGLVSLCVFATVAFAERWMYAQLGLLGAYLAWTTLFILLGGAVLGSLVAGRWRLPRFYLLFGLAFFAYAAGWVGAYFVLRGAAGEWVGSLAGSLLMGFVLAVGFGTVRSALKLSAILFVANSAGYFLGSALNNWIGATAGMLLWGAAYGLSLGAGLGAVLHLAQVQRSGSLASK
ncbi:MAG: hypothetical protein AABN95_25115 [Acidobacteriota bacterium]